MATCTGAAVGSGLGSGMAGVWPYIGAYYAYDLGSSIYKRLRQRFGSSTTKYGISNETKKYFARRGRFSRAKRLRFYKWISNGYNYKQDLAYELKVNNGGTEISFSLLGTNTTSSNVIEVTNFQTNRMTALKDLFDTYRCTGIVLTFKPYQIVKTDTTTANNAPNILFGIFTGNEWTQNGESFPITNEKKQKYVDRPFTRIIAADDDLRMYRPFRLKNYETGYILTQTDALFHHWCPTNIDANENTLYLMGFTLGNAPTRTNAGDWNIGTIKVSVYYKFRNSKI